MWQFRQREGYTFATQIHNYGLPNQLVHSWLLRDADMQALADSGVKMPKWWGAKTVRLVDAYFEADSRQDADKVFEAIA